MNKAHLYGREEFDYDHNDLGTLLCLVYNDNQNFIRWLFNDDIPCGAVLTEMELPDAEFKRNLYRRNAEIDKVLIDMAVDLGGDEVQNCINITQT